MQDRENEADTHVYAGVALKEREAMRLFGGSGDNLDRIAATLERKSGLKGIVLEDKVIIIGKELAHTRLVSISDQEYIPFEVKPEVLENIASKLEKLGIHAQVKTYLVSYMT